MPSIPGTFWLWHSGGLGPELARVRVTLGPKDRHASRDARAGARRAGSGGFDPGATDREAVLAGDLDNVRQVPIVAGLDDHALAAKDVHLAERARATRRDDIRDHANAVAGFELAVDRRFCEVIKFGCHGLSFQAARRRYGVVLDAQV